MPAGGARPGTGSKALVCSGIRVREVRNGHEALSAAIVLGGVRAWENGGGDCEDLADFFRDPLCEYLADAGGLSYREVLRRTVLPDKQAGQQLEG